MSDIPLTLRTVTLVNSSDVACFVGDYAVLVGRTMYGEASMMFASLSRQDVYSMFLESLSMSIIKDVR